jgi:hypothetical protein
VSVCRRKTRNGRTKPRFLLGGGSVEARFARRENVLIAGNATAVSRRGFPFGNKQLLVR